MLRGAQLVIFVSSPQQSTCAQLASSRTSPIGHSISSMGGLSSAQSVESSCTTARFHGIVRVNHSTLQWWEHVAKKTSGHLLKSFLGQKFWCLIFLASDSPYEPSSATDGATSIVPGSFSLLQRPGSWANLCSGWAAGKLTRSLLRDCNLDISPDGICSNLVPLDFGSTERSKFSFRCSVVELTTEQSSAESCPAILERTTAPATSSSSSTSRVLSDTTRSRTPRRMKKPWMNRSRGEQGMAMAPGCC